MRRGESTKPFSQIATAALLTTSLAISATAGAQVPDLVDISGQYMPSADLPDAAPASVQVASYDATINGPIPLGENTFFIVGANYHVDAVSFADVPPDFTQLRAFHSLEFSALFVQLLPSDWSLSLRLAPGLAGDFAAIDNGLFRMNALAMATHSFSDDFILGGGGIISYSFGNLLPLPAVYLDWKPFDELRIETFLPAFLNIKVLPHDRVEFGVRAEFAGNSYGIRDKRVHQRWPCVGETSDRLATTAIETQAQPAQCLDNIAYSIGSAGPTLNVRLFDTVWLNAFAGYSFYRRFEPLNESGDTIGKPQDLPNDLLLRVGATWRVPEF